MQRTGAILRAIFDSTDDVWFFVAPDHSILFFNRKAYENGKLLHGRELKTGDNILDYARDTKNEVDVRFLEKFRQATAGELVIDRQEIQYGSATLWFQSKYVPVFDGQTLLGISIAVSDITEEKKLEQEKEAAGERIKQLLRKREEFMSIASHELKTPLTGIKSLIQLLLRKARQGQADNFEELLQKANQQVNKLTLLVNDLLDVTRIHRGKLTLSTSSFKLKTVLEDCMFILQPQAQTHRFSITGDAGITVTADRERLEQVICNLLSNAIKYSGTGTEINVHTAVSDRWLTISVTDQGVGIPEDKIHSIFKRFFRVDESAEHKPGLGLGLYIANEIIVQHGGRIEVTSDPGRGSCFSVLLPSNLATA